MFRLVTVAGKSVGNLSMINSRSTSSLAQQFEQAQKRLQSLKEDPGNAAKLKIYALFKQATEGACNKPKPGMMDFVGKAKWEAWSGLGSMDNEEAMRSYVQLVQELAGSAQAQADTASADAADSADGFKESLYSVSDDGICLFTLNRPAKKNALTGNLYREWMRAMEQAAADSRVKAMAITGAGDFFSSGNDLSNFTQMPDGMNPQQLAQDSKVLLHEFVTKFIDFPKPLIGLINGPAVGISVTTLGLYDLVLASDNATFHTPFSSLGQTAEGCSSLTFPRMMGLTSASAMLLFNKKLSAQEAERLGLVAEVLPSGTFAKEADQKLRQIALLPKQTMILGKKLIREPLRQQLHAVNSNECEQLQERWLSEDCMNAIASFFSKKSKL